MIGTAASLGALVLIYFGTERLIKEDTVSPKPHREDTAIVVGDDSCVKLTPLSPEVIPHYLLNSIGSKNFPYWLKVIVSNDCGADKFITVRYEGGRNVILKPAANGLGFNGQLYPLFVGKPEPPSFELIHAHTVLFDQVVDNGLLIAVDLAGQGDDQEVTG